MQREVTQLSDIIERAEDQMANPRWKAGPIIYQILKELIAELKAARAERDRLYDVEQMAERMADADDGIIFGLLTPDEAEHYLRMARAAMNAELQGR
jgi:hypothetical protein